MPTREYVYPTMAAARRAAARVPIPDTGVSVPGANCGGRTAPATAAVQPQASEDGSEIVIRVPRDTPELDEDSTTKRDYVRPTRAVAEPEVRER